MALDGKKAVVFGGCGGIGFAICQNLLRNGVQKLYILDVSELSEPRRMLLKDCNVQAELLFKQCDISNRTELRKTLQEDVLGALGSIDIFVNSAGIANADVGDKIIAINLTGVINACLCALGLMSKAKGGNGGVIINVASTTGLEPFPFLPIYCASKHGVIGFTRSLGVSQVYDETGVKFINICPGATETSMFDKCHSIDIEIDALNKIFPDYMAHFVVQSPDVVGACVVRAIKEGENGSTWVCNEGTSAPFPFPAPQYL